MNGDRSNHQGRVKVAGAECGLPVRHICSAERRILHATDVG